MIAGGDHTIIQRISSARLFFPKGKTTSAQAPTMQYQIFANEIRKYYVETWCICNIDTLPSQFGSAQKFATLAGGYYPPLRTQSSLPSANYAQRPMPYVCVGADIIRPVVFPWEKQRRRKAPTIEPSITKNMIRWHDLTTLYHPPHRPNSVWWGIILSIYHVST